MERQRLSSSSDSDYLGARRARRLYVHRPTRWDVALCAYMPLGWLFIYRMLGGRWSYNPLWLVAWPLATLASCCIGVRGIIRNGSVKRYASMLTKARGMRTPATATTEASSSLRARIGQWVDVQTDAPTSITPEHSFLWHGGFGIGTVNPGASGALPVRAAFGECYTCNGHGYLWASVGLRHVEVPCPSCDNGRAWDRANREKLG